jgi:biofilm PGA synthesis N-glycosyltransferase PgaC
MNFLINFVFFFTVILLLLYVGLGLFSSLALRRYTHKNSYVNYDHVAISPLSPPVTIISPAYNEEKSIINTAKTLMGLHYSNFEVIIINDGSSDDTLKLLKKEFKLQKTNYFFDYKIPCEKIKGIWKSTDQKYKRLVVLDKNNGGSKADAINAALNVTRNDLVVTIDADSIIEPDSISKMVKPFLEEKKKKVIGAGGAIRILNSCKVENGRIKEINLPKKLLAKLQVLEYTRSFLLGRMAWSQLDGLMLISGAMGMFDKKTMIKCGGYDTTGIGEDMEVVLKMRKYMATQKKEYIVTYIPDPLCWTEVPEDVKSLKNQRSRWTMGLIDSLEKYRGMFMNPKYKRLGMLGYPFWFIFEWLAPILASLGILYTIFLIATSAINWPFFLLITGFIYSFSVFLSAWTVLFEEITFHKYRNKKDVIKLLLVSLIEPFLYPMHAYFAVVGNVKYAFNKQGWGKIKRTGNKTD